MTSSVGGRRRSSQSPGGGLSGPGLGLDIVEIARVEAVGRRNPAFLRRVFSPEEIRYCSGKKNQWQHFAVRFAAKEAVWKALGEAGVALNDISVRRDSSGRPGVLLRGRPAPHIRLSLSHSEQFAAAVAMALPLPPRLAPLPRGGGLRGPASGLGGRLGSTPDTRPPSGRRLRPRKLLRASPRGRLAA